MRQFWIKSGQVNSPDKSFSFSHNDSAYGVQDESRYESTLRHFNGIRDGNEKLAKIAHSFYLRGNCACQTIIVQPQLSCVMHTEKVANEIIKCQSYHHWAQTPTNTYTSSPLEQSQSESCLLTYCCPDKACLNQKYKPTSETVRLDAEIQWKDTTSQWKRQRLTQCRHLSNVGRNSSW